MTREEAIKVLMNTEDNIKYDAEYGIYFTNKWMGAYEMSIAALREQEEQKAILVQQYIKVTEPSKWIGVEDRLPEKNTPVLAYKDGRIWYCERNWQSGCWESLGFAETKEYGMYWSKGLTHWMPLPESPEVEV